MGKIIDIEIIYKGNDVRAANPMSDSQIRRADQEKISNKFNEIAGILQLHNVQRLQIIDISKTMSARIDEDNLDAFNMDIDPLNFHAQKPEEFDMSIMCE